MNKRIYIETSITSYYHEIRQELECLAKKNWTRQWWDIERFKYEIFTSEAVEFELQNGNYPTKDECLDFIKDIPLLEVNDEIEEIVEAYISHKLMPKNPVGDALHLAIASYYKCDFLLTWNCTNLANANKFNHIHIINHSLGLYSPSLITPLQLIENEVK